MLESLYEFVEVVSTVVIALALISLVVQLRRSTVAMRSQTTHGAHDQIADIYLELSTDPALTSVVVKGMEDDAELSETESAQLFAFYMGVLLRLENIYFQTLEDKLDRRVLTSWARVIGMVARTPRFRDFWQQRKAVFQSEFRQFMKDSVFIEEEMQGFKPLGVKHTG